MKHMNQLHSASSINNSEDNQINYSGNGSYLRLPLPMFITTSQCSAILQGVLT